MAFGAVFKRGDIFFALLDVARINRLKLVVINIAYFIKAYLFVAKRNDGVLGCFADNIT